MGVRETVEIIERILKEEKVTTVWKIQKKTRKSVVGIYKALLFLLMEGKIDVDVLERNVVVRYKFSEASSQLLNDKNHDE